MQAYTALREAGVTKAQLQKTSIQATSADSNEIKVLGTVEGHFTLYIGKKVATNVQRFLVIKNLQHAMNIGIRFLQKIGAVLNFGENSLQIGPTSIQLLPPKKKASFASIEEINGGDQHQKGDFTKGTIRVYNKSTTTIPPHSVSIIHLKLHSKEDRLNRHSKDGNPPAL